MSGPSDRFESHEAHPYGEGGGSGSDEERKEGQALEPFGTAGGLSTNGPVLDRLSDEEEDSSARQLKLLLPGAFESPGLT